jgi:ribonuclease VapC
VIAVDTSALMAILRGEPEAEACLGRLRTEAEVLISAATVAEALIVAARRGFGAEMISLIDIAKLEIVAVTEASAHRCAQAYALWGRGVHPAGLNYGDCFSYIVAKDHGCPLLYVGDDFSKTDLKSAL